MCWTRVKINVAVLLIAGLGGAKAAAGAEKPDEAQTIARNRALSRLNLKKLARAMLDYADANKGLLPPPALINKEGKAVLSWRVLLLPYLGERELYEQFKLSEPWDSPHNKKLLSKMPNVFAPPGIKTRQLYSTFYQVFVSPKPKDGRKGAEAGGPLGVEIQAAFVQGQPQIYPAHFSDGTYNTILVVEAGKAVAWTKPEDLPYAADQPLPELGGLFRDVFQAALADGDVYTLTKKYNEFSLRRFITSNDGKPHDPDDIIARSAAGNLRRKNRELRQDLEDVGERLRLLQEERDALLGRAGGAKRTSDSDARLDELRKENARLQKELEKTKEELQDLSAEVQRRLRKPMPKKAP
jgi:hypothetical protein